MPCGGLGVTDGKVDFASKDAGQDPLLLLWGAESHEGRADAVQSEERQGYAGPVRLLDENHLVDGASGLPAVLGGPSDSQPSVLTHAADVADIRRLLLLTGNLDLSNQMFEVLPELTLQIPLLRCEFQLHRGLRGTASSDRAAIIATISPHC